MSLLHQSARSSVHLLLGLPLLFLPSHNSEDDLFYQSFILHPAYVTEEVNLSPDPIIQLIIQLIDLLNKITHLAARYCRDMQYHVHDVLSFHT